MAGPFYVNYGCGASVAEGWLNFDASPTLFLENLPLVPRKVFPKGVQYGNIVKGLPLPPASCAGIYASHVLEHLSLEDCRRALHQTYTLLQLDGTFRLVVPDLEAAAKTYLENPSPEAAPTFLRETLLGEETRPKGLGGLLRSWLGHSRHYWMWDEASMIAELEAVGFRDIRRCAFNDGSDIHFKAVEEQSRFDGALALEARR